MRYEVTCFRLLRHACLAPCHGNMPWQHAMACPTILALKRTMTQQKTTLEQ